jgi:hypothetical protein
VAVRDSRGRPLPHYTVRIPDEGQTRSGTRETVAHFESLNSDTASVSVSIDPG